MSIQFFHLWVINSKSTPLFGVKSPSQRISLTIHENASKKTILKTGNLCCPRIWPGCKKDGDKHNCDLFCNWQLQLIRPLPEGGLFSFHCLVFLFSFLFSLRSEKLLSLQQTNPCHTVMTYEFWSFYFCFPELFQEEPIAAITANWKQKNRPQGPILIISPCKVGELGDNHSIQK